MGEGTSHSPFAVLPQATTEPSDFRPRLCKAPAATAVNPVLGAGTSHWPSMLSPHAATVPSLLKLPGWEKHTQLTNDWLAGTANVVLQTLAPRYVQSVLGLDPADAVYVFAPSTIGLGLAIVVTPTLIRRLGELDLPPALDEIALFADGRAVVRDLGSRNGTWLNDIRLKAEAPLEVGDRLVLGNAPTVLVVAALEI